MSFTPSEVVLGASLPLENGSTITFSVAGHVETERDCDDAVVIFARKLLKYTNSASDADRLTVRQVISSITSTPLDKVPDVGTPTPPAPVKEPAKVAPPVAAPAPVMGPAPTAAEQAAAAVAQCIKPPADAGDIARQQHADKLKADLERLQADHDARVAQRQAAAQPPPTADDLASAITAEKQDAAAAQAEEVLAIESRVAGATERPHPDAKPEQAKAPAPRPAPSAPPTPEASVSGAPQSGEVCANCGAAVSASQAKLSQLFQSKTLCKSCMEAP